MQFAIICRDKPGALEIRKATREAHLAYLQETGAVVMAGPFLNESDEMTGSLLIIEAEDLSAARAWAEGDPYYKAGLFETVTIDSWKKTVG